MVNQSRQNISGEDENLLRSFIATHPFLSHLTHQLLPLCDIQTRLHSFSITFSQQIGFRTEAIW
jgi:hypothetical protein